MISNMNIPRSGVALSSFKDQYLVAIGGRMNQTQIVHVVEIYDIKRNVWMDLTRQIADMAQWVPAYMSNCYQVTENEIIIFGGKSKITNQIFNGSFIFNLETMTIKEKGSLVNPSSFMNTPIVYQNCLYAFGNDIYIHKYVIPEQKWTCFPKQI